MKIEADFLGSQYLKTLVHLITSSKIRTTISCPSLKDIADNYDLIVFATPVYWYSMSGLMKNFFDRISDCLKIEKPTGRKLRGKSMALMICGSETAETPGFDIPFKLSAEYLGMNYLGYVHTWVDEDVSEEVKQRVKEFGATLVAQTLV